MAADGNILLRILLLQSIMLGALCCNCTYIDPQRQFCTHEFVLRVRVTEMPVMPNNTTFLVEIMELFRGNYQKLILSYVDNVNIFMPRLCAIDYLRVGDVYAIFGSNSHGIVHTDKCSGTMKWDQVPSSVKRGLYFYYKSGCDCIGPTEKLFPCSLIFSNHNEE